MRVITGIYKGRRFDIPKTFKARPTTDFAKENIFNVLNQYINFEDINALDLFAGTGSISIELLSRGCKTVTSIEIDQEHCRFIRQCVDKIGAENHVLLRRDALRFLKTIKTPFNLVFADPPYALSQLSKLPELVLNSNVLTNDGLFILEHGKTDSFTNHPLFVEHRAYGSVNFSIFRMKE